VGIDRVRPLAGGFAGWIELGYPVEKVTAISVESASSVD